MIIKRLFDVIFSLFFLILFGWFLIIIFIVSSIDTRSNGIFIQQRVGQFGKLFSIFKFKTIHPITRKISPIGYFLRNYKLDELPQFVNVLTGDMSIVGPRPDIEGYYDVLQGSDREILNLKPGITGPASLKYFNEESILSKMKNPQQYNDEVIFPDKVKINLDYYKNISILTDIKIIYKTIFK